MLMTLRYFALSLLAIGAIPMVMSQTCRASEQPNIQLTGDMLRVCALVFDDFSRHLQVQPAGLQPDALADIHNYNVDLECDDRFCTLTLVPRSRGDAPVFGGGGMYRVSRATFAIVERQFYK